MLIHISFPRAKPKVPLLTINKNKITDARLPEIESLSSSALRFLALTLICFSAGEPCREIYFFSIPRYRDPTSWLLSTNILFSFPRTEIWPWWAYNDFWILVTGAKEFAKPIRWPSLLVTRISYGAGLRDIFTGLSGQILSGEQSILTAKFPLSPNDTPRPLLQFLWFFWITSEIFGSILLVSKAF